VSLWLFVLFSFGMLTYFFHPRNVPLRRQNRAVALAYYACAPWAYFVIVPLIGLAFFGFAVVMDKANQGRPPVLALAIGWVIAIVPLVTWLVTVWFVPQRMLAVTVHCSMTRLLFMGLIVHPLGYLVCALLTVGVINLTYWAIVLMIHSLR
jgi:hypothetical protein